MVGEHLEQGMKGMLNNLLAPVVKARSSVGRMCRRMSRSISGRLWPIVTPEQRETFERDGFLLIDPQMPDGVIEQVKSDLAERYDRARPGAPRYPLLGRIQDAWQFSKAVLELALWPRVFQILRQLYGREPLPFQTLNFPVGTEQNAHSDTIHFNSSPGGWMCGVWWALEDIDETCGPLVYYPGSHKLPEYTLEDIPAKVVPESYESYREYEQFIQNLIRSHNLQPRYALMRKGQAFIWSSNLLHGGSARRDLKRSRHSQVTHYFFEGCQYYTPLWSTREKVFWREPAWIR